jgi:hypothetical protein
MEFIQTHPLICAFGVTYYIFGFLFFLTDEDFRALPDEIITTKMIRFFNSLFWPATCTSFILLLPLFKTIYGSEVYNGR